MARCPLVRVAILAALVVSGCGGMQRSEDLLTAVTTYNDGVRWSRFPAAASKLMPAERDAFLDERDQLADDLRITDYEVIRVRADQSAVRAVVQIKYTWFLDSRGIVHETHSVQDWERHGKFWMLAAEHRMRGEAMPGLAERAEADAGGDAGAGPPRSSAVAESPSRATLQ